MLFVVGLGCGRLIVGDAWWVVRCCLYQLVGLEAWLARPAGAVSRLWRVAFLPFRACAGPGWLPFRGRRRWPIWIWRTCCDGLDWRGANDNGWMGLWRECRMQSSSCRQAGRGRNCGEKVMLDWSDDAIGENRVTKPDWVDFKASPPRPASTTFEGHSMRIHSFFFPLSSTVTLTCALVL